MMRPRSVGGQRAVQRVPRLHRVVVGGHVGHGAPGRKVGQDHAHVVGREHVRRFGHEVNAAEDHIPHRRAAGALAHQPRGDLREFQRIARVVGVTDHLVGLVVVPQDHQLLAQLRPARADGRGEVFARHRAVALGERWLPEHGGCVWGLYRSGCLPRGVAAGEFSTGSATPGFVPCVGALVRARVCGARGGCGCGGGGGCVGYFDSRLNLSSVSLSWRTSSAGALGSLRTRSYACC